ncbi:hypothetical protein D3C84_1088480 [compost metagenome]
MQCITQAVLQRLAKAQPVDGAGTVLIDLRGRRLPAGETAFTEAFNHLTQPRQDRIPFKVPSAAALIHPST